MEPVMLADFDIQGCINECIANYLQNNALTFLQIKALLINRKPIIELQVEIEDLINKVLESDIQQLTEDLEAQIYKKQIIDDEQELRNERISRIKEMQLKERFNQELNTISLLIAKSQEEQAHIMQGINQSALPYITQAANINLSTLMLNQWNSSMQQYGQRIQFLSEKRKIIQTKLEQIEQRAELNKKHQLDRTTREHARIIYQNTKINVDSTLSKQNKAVLREGIATQKIVLEKKCIALKAKAEAIHFDSFLKKLSEFLSSMPLKANELHAAQDILKLIKQHRKHHGDIILFQEYLKKKKVTISSLINQLHYVQKKHCFLTTHLPLLKEKNEQVQTSINNATNKVEKKVSRQRNLTTAAWLLLGLTCVGSIPLILLLSSALSMPNLALFYCLLVIPTLLGLSTIGVVIASLVYFLHIRTSKRDIAHNQVIKEKNALQIEKGMVSEKELQQFTMPRLEAKIKQEEAVREELQVFLQQAEHHTKDTLLRAEHINPLSIEPLSLFHTSSPNAPEPDLSMDVTSYQPIAS